MTSKIAAAEGLGRFLQPLSDLFELRDSLMAAGQLDGDVAQARSDLAAVRADVAVEQEKLDALLKSVAEAKAAGDQAVEAAEAQAARIVARAKAEADERIEAIEALVATRKAAGEKTLAAIAVEITQAAERRNVISAEADAAIERRRLAEAAVADLRKTLGA